MEDMRREASIMKKLDHPNVVNLIDVIDDPKAEQLYLVQEFCAGGAVMENLEGSSPLEEPLARRYFRDLLCGIDYLHAHQIIHRDIKPMNLLITSTGLLKIGDFGAARVLSSDSKQTLGIAGTPAFMAPELLGQEPSLYDGPAVDLWSCGATLFMLVTGVPPWMASDELTLAKRVQNDELVFPGAFATKLNPHLRNLLTRLLVKDPAQRMTLTQTMLHEWVTEEGADPLERFVDLQPQLIRVNSKRLMSPPRQLSPTLSSAVAAAVAGLTQDVNQQLNSAIAASTANTTTTTTATESQFSAASEDSDDLDAITLVHNDSTPFMSSGLRKRYNHRTFPDGDVSMNTGSPGSPVVHVGDDLSEMFALSPTTARHSPPFHRPAPLLSLQGHKEPSPTSDGNSQGMERVDSLDYAQIDVGRGCMTNTKNPAAADSTGTMYSTASSGGSRHLPHTSSGLAHSPNISSASLHQQQLLLQRQQPSSKGKKDVVDAFTKRHMSSSGGLKRHVGGSRGSSTDLRGAMDVYANKRAALGPRTLTGESSSTFNGRQVTSSRSRPRPDSPPQRQATILSFMDDADFMEVEDHDVDVDDEDEHEHMDKGEENDGMEEDSLEEDLDEEEDCVRPRSFGNGPFDMTIQPLPFGAPAIIKARRGSVVSHCRIKYGYGEDQGLRSSMEDFIAIVPKLKKPETFFAAVFDGHGGDRVAKELKARLHRVLGASPEFATDLPTAIKKTCLGLDRAMLHYAASELLDLESKIQLGDQQKSLFRTKGGGSKHMESAADLLRKTGSTAVIALVRSLELTVAWVGDSRAVLCRAGSAVEVSRDHKASRTDEMQRIRDFGGTVDRQGRLYGDLAVSRAFGDLQHKGRELRTIFTEGASGPEEFFGAEGTLIALPDITTLQLTPQDEFLILASDGIWDVMSSEEAVNFVRFHLHKHGDVRKAAMELVDKAVEMHSMDNVSAVVLAFGGKKS
ncbi:hypothetical protein BASA81_005648 [Batrachochytrium salamandrivorans]|nr:hypothetical protein BASA81_005648 [Batrachochytrium salamandrivorans]